MKIKLDKKSFIIFMCVSLIAFLSMGLGNDYFWHVKAGEYMVSNFKIPYFDIFSWYGIVNNLYWMSHEWLSEVFIYISRYLFKDFGPYIFCFITYIVLLLILYICNKEKLQKNKLFIIIWAALAVIIFSSFILPRPHMISYILLALTIYLLFDNYNNKESKKIYFLPIISLLWVNFHGGSSNLPYIFCFIFLIIGLIKFNFGKITSDRIDKKQLIRYLICGLLCILVLFINPHGIKMITYPYINMMDSFMINTIVEWFSPTLNNSNDYGSFILFIFVILVMLITEKKIRLIDLLVLGLVLALGLKSRKFVPFVYIVSMFIIPNYVKEMDVNYSKFHVVMCLVLVLVSGYLLLPKIEKSYTDKIVSDKIINYIKEKKPERIYNDYNIGGYLIYNDIKVFIDGRADMYSKHNFREAIDIQFRGYKGLINYYNFDMIITEVTTPLANHLGNNSDYKYVLTDGEYNIYEKVFDGN